MGQDSKRLSRSIQTRWTAALVEDGFTPIANTFLVSYARLSPPITSAEAMLIVHLISYKWDRLPPRPAIDSLAKMMGLTSTATRNIVRKLDKKGYIVRRARRGKANYYDLRPLFSALERIKAEDKQRKKAAVESLLVEFDYA